MKIGDRYRFRPFGFEAKSNGKGSMMPCAPAFVTGEVVYINQAHQYFTVEVHFSWATLRESFKFSEAHCGC